MNLRKYYITTGLIALLLSPLAVGIGLVGFVHIFSAVINLSPIEADIELIGVMLFVFPVLILSFVWILYSKKAALPEKASEIFFSIFLAFCYYMLVWIAVFGLSNYRLNSNLFNNFFYILTIPYLITNSILDFEADLSFFPFVNIAILIVTILTIVITRAFCKKKIIYDKRVILYVLIFICLSGITGFQFYDRSTKILTQDSEAEQIRDELDLYQYRPFRKNNLLKLLNEPAAISFYENYPKLDGATAAYPVYGAIAQALYTGLDENTIERYVTCSKTDKAYERLIRGEIDIFFGAQPSKQQIELAKENGVEFNLTPVAKEAFVFFVNKENPVNTLTLEQIQDIYQKKIVNWKIVGGNDEKIMPFQRPENSGSQTIMRAFVMRDKSLPAPLWEEYADLMKGIISQVATYRNYSSSVGYSFRYFATGMAPNDNITLLAINGIEPTVENIRDGSYPFTIEVYAVTAGPANENTGKLIEWILSEQGQSFIETCGYVHR